MSRQGQPKRKAAEEAEAKRSTAKGMKFNACGALAQAPSVSKIADVTNGPQVSKTRLLDLERELQEEKKKV
jgi:hypothetical protein